MDPLSAVLITLMSSFFSLSAVTSNVRIFLIDKQKQKLVTKQCITPSLGWLHSNITLDLKIFVAV